MPETVSYLSPNALKPHPRNEEFFSNIEGEDYEQLKQSISELGVLTPLRVASDMTIISGHQRYRAANELGFNQVPVVIDENLHDEDDKLQQLIASNFGRLKNDPIKQAKWLKEYERLRGVRQGGGGRYAKELRHKAQFLKMSSPKSLALIGEHFSVSRSSWIFIPKCSNSSPLGRFQSQQEADSLPDLPKKNRRNSSLNCQPLVSSHQAGCQPERDHVLFRRSYPDADGQY